MLRIQQVTAYSVLPEVLAAPNLPLAVSTMWQKFILFGAAEPRFWRRITVKSLFMNALKKVNLLFAYRKIGAVRMYER